MSLTDFVSKGWNDHATDAASVMRRLPEGIPLVTEEAHAPQLAALVVHVAGEHLGQWSDGDALLRRILDRGVAAPGSAGERAVWRARAVLAHCAGDVAAERENMARAGGEASDQVRMLATAASAQLGQKRVAEAMRDFEAALDVASYGPMKEDPAAMALAVTGNNISCELEQRATRTQAETSFMIMAATTARLYWEIAGDWTNVERADYRLSAAHLAAGDALQSLEHARKCLATCTRHAAPPFEMFFAHERVAYAQAALGDGGAASSAVAAAEAALGAIEDAGDRDYCKGELGKLKAAVGAA